VYQTTSHDQQRLSGQREFVVADLMVADLMVACFGHAG
jgi:hypothetical protein